MTQALDRVRLFARDLRKEFPRGPRDTSIGGYVIAARALDKCRADLVGTNGEYNWDCPLDKRFFGFTEIDGAAFREFVATGATDEEVSAWVIDHAKQKDREEVVQWNNKERDRRLSDLSPKSQVYMEDYIKNHLPRNRIVYHYFDIYDLEEQRI